jgi:hypothetical protein
MPDSVIKKVKFPGRRAQQNTFDFANRNGVLFEWNDTVDEQQEGLVEEDLVPYPLLAKEFLVFTQDRDTPDIKDKIAPQGRTEDAAAHNANLAPLDVVARVDGPTIISTHNDKFEYNNADYDIIAVANINQGGAPQLQPIVKVDNTDNNANNSNDDDDSNDDDNDSIGDDDESIKTFGINSNQAIRMTTKMTKKQ